ncbi:MAG: hypothetical protein H6710_14260 [Myxococcales bacterium]|nr:hypothetical protein [Myxococcales bacterium]MCB9705074.1 hypothetical protein [Myxococcales bacterium]
MPVPSATSIHSPPPPPDPRRARRLARRTRTLILAISLAALGAVASALWSPEPTPTPRLLGIALVGAAGVLVFEALLGRLRQRWQGGWRQALVDLGDRVKALMSALWPAAPKSDADAPTLRTGERLALIAGCGLTALDVVLTTLLLRDVFPEPPYRFEILGVVSPEAVEWSFYLVVALFKALLELWLGVVDRLRSQEGSSPLRYFVLGLASAFDAALAVARGLLLAEQGITGAAVTTSNIVFVGFGLAIPWVVAHTGGLMVRAADPFLTRFGLLRMLTLLPRMLLTGAIWALAIAVGLPLIVMVAAIGVLAMIWSALDEVVALILGHDDPEAPIDAMMIADEGIDAAPPPASERPTAGSQLTSLREGARGLTLAPASAALAAEGADLLAPIGGGR